MARVEDSGLEVDTAGLKDLRCCFTLTWSGYQYADCHFHLLTGFSCRWHFDGFSVGEKEGPPAGSSAWSWYPWVVAWVQEP